MTRLPERSPTSLERLSLRLARWIAGSERGPWIDALEAELHHLDCGRTDWVLGGLVAAIKDRGWRERYYAIAVLAAPTAALIALPFAAILTSFLATVIGTSPQQLVSIIALSPLPFAMTLGAIWPRRPPIVSGVLGFIAYQVIPAITLPVLFGQYVCVRWELNLGHYGLMPPAGLAGALVLWCFGAWVGAKRARRKLS